MRNIFDMTTLLIYLVSYDTGYDDGNRDLTALSWLPFQTLLHLPIRQRKVVLTLLILSMVAVAMEKLPIARLSTLVLFPMEQFLLLLYLFVPEAVFH